MMADTSGRTSLTRVTLFVLSALALWVALALLYPASPSERFHIVVPVVWAFDFTLFRLEQVRLRWGVVVSVALGMSLGLWYFLLLRANAMGGRVDVSEPLWWMLFLISMLVLYHWLSVVLTQFIMLPPAVWLFTPCRGVVLKQFIMLLPTGRERLSTPTVWWLRLLRGGMALILFLPYLYTVCNIHRFKIANATDPHQSYGMSYEPVKFLATDGVSLRGWFIPAQDSDRTVLVCHGIRANKGNFLGFVPFLHRAGFNVFIFDFRGHGDSPGHTVSFGYYEARDVRGAVEYLSGRPDTKHILGYGFSMGASSLLQAMPDLAILRGVVVDSTFADMTLLGRQQMAFLPDAIEAAMMRVIAFWTRVELGVPLSAIAPSRHINAISPRPLLIIHGGADGLISPSQAELNFGAAEQPKELWLVPDAGHIQPMHVQEVEYQRRVVKFFKHCVDAPTARPRRTM